MTFSSPWNLLYLIPALGGITLLYLLRRPRRNIVVPSTLFWNMLPEQSIRANRLQKFVPQLLFFLQIIAALLLVCAAAGPAVYSLQPPPRIWAFVIDNGGSMNAISGDESRLQVVKDKAAAMLAQSLRPVDRCIIVTTAGNADIVEQPNSIANAQFQTIREIYATDEKSNIPNALSLASAALKQATADHRSDVAGVVLGTDDADTTPGSEIAKAMDGVPILGVLSGGTDHDGTNLAITRLSVVRDPAQPESRLDLFLEARGYGMSSTEQAQVTFSVDGKTLSRQHVAVSPNAPTVLSATINAPAKDSALKATLTSSATDILRDDNTAWAILPAAGSTRVLLISDGDSALERALSLLPGVQVDEASSANFEKFSAPGGYNAYIADAGPENVNASQLPGNALIWGGAEKAFVPSSSPPGSQEIVDWDRSHPVLRFVDLGDVALNSPSWSYIGDWQSLAENGSGTVIAALDTPARRAIRASFSPAQSGFASQAAFPIFVSNAISWLTEQAGRSEVAGTPINLSPVSGGWTVTDPSGETTRNICDGQPSSACTDSQTSIAGIYTANSGAKSIQFARNFDPTASDIVPKPHDIEASPETSTNSERRNEAMDILPFAAVLCLIMLMIEWAVFHRGR